MPLLLPTLALLLLQDGDLAPARSQAAAAAEAGDFARAVNILEDAGAWKSRDVQALAELGRYQLRLGESLAAGGADAIAVTDAFAQAASTLKKACGLDGAPEEAFVDWSEAELNTSNFKMARRAAVQGLEAHPDSLGVRLQLARVVLAEARQKDGEARTGLQEEARRVLQEAARRHRDSALPLVRLGELEVLAGDREAAVEAWREALQRNPDEVDLGALGQWLPGTAAELIEELLERRPEDATLRWYQGMARYNALTQGDMEQYPALRSAFERVLELNPSFTNAWYFLADAAFRYATWLQSQGREDDARREFNEAATGWARYLKDFGAYQRQALAASPEAAEAFYANMKWLSGKAYEFRNPACVDLARWVAEGRSQDAEAWNNYAFFCREVGNAGESLRAYEHALSLAPGDPQILNDLAVILHYYLKRDDDRARELYRKAIERAEAILASGEKEGQDLDLVRTALRDARNNLAKLEKGDRRNF